MPDRICVHRLSVFARHGVLAEEERLGQRFSISLTCEVDLTEAGRSDDVARTVSYADLAEIAGRIAIEQRFSLIEALAWTIAGEVLERFQAISSVSVRVEKPGAPVPAVIDGVSVEVTRSRANERGSE